MFFFFECRKGAMQGNSWNFRFSNEKQLHNTFVSGYILLRSSDSFFLFVLAVILRNVLLSTWKSARHRNNIVHVSYALVPVCIWLRLYRVCMVCCGLAQSTAQDEAL